MQHQIFSIPVFGGEAENEEMNNFVRAHKVIKVDKYFVQKPDGDYWTFCFLFVEGDVSKNIKSKIEKVDYAKLLPPDQALVFEQMKKIRKSLADKDGIPAFAVFSDEELYYIAQLPQMNATELKKIQGVGLKKLEKYGQALIDLLSHK